ncbi:PREDICTED: histone-lysine N-methyltransferase SETMAR-like [Acromyrmex echinatior]|uniref:histone-lysine N-methyltransferase SETMAR-like n=1 Tax=Acromyrmex echinatior TaxID=103372 RepID=UPI000580BA98|nr:PREDICTED: histone-lysine N-methyltransferase SETMAR-like [Acromyrmex echinatior]
MSFLRMIFVCHLSAHCAQSSAKDILSEMASQIPEEVHIRHCMLFEFHKGSNATVATKNICDVYPSALDVRKCQRWFSKFKSGNFDLFDSYRSGRPTTLDNDMLRAEVEVRVRQSRNCQTLLTNLGRPSKNICSRLVKQAEQVFGSRIICPKKTKLTGPPYATYCFSDTIQKRFLIA